MFGKNGDAPDLDLDLAARDGPANKKCRTSVDLDADSETDGDPSTESPFQAGRETGGHTQREHQQG